MVKIIIVALALLVIMFSGCLDGDYTGTYVDDQYNDRLTLFSDGTFSVQGATNGYSGTYNVVDGKLYLKHPLVAISFTIEDDKIYDNNGHCFIKQ